MKKFKFGINGNVFKLFLYTDKSGISRKYFKIEAAISCNNNL